MFENCKYVISAVTEAQYPNKEGKPEFAFFGRSNVGKSSLVNAITGKKLLAKVSSKPGKTICMNFFSIDERFYFIENVRIELSTISDKLFCSIETD